MTTKAEYTRQAREACLRAAERIAEKGWHQGAAFDPEFLDAGMDVSAAPTCAMGALQVCTPMNFDYTKVIWAASELIRDEIGKDEWPNVPQWNDAPDRTAEEVILALKRVGHGE